MFTPNATAVWLKKAPRRTLTGGEIFEAPRPIAIGIVELADAAAPTTVRADSSASRGAADQRISDAKILIPPAFAISIGDVLKVDGINLEIASVQPRRSVFGKLDHREVLCNARPDL
jgi:hypothetical protein